MSDKSTENLRKTPSSLNEIINGLIGKLQKPSQNQSLNEISPLRKKSLKIFARLDKLSDKYVKHASLKALVMGFLRPHVTNVIAFLIPEKELSEALRESYEELRPDFEEIAIAKELKLGPTDSTLTKKIMNLPAFKQYQEIGEALF